MTKSRLGVLGGLLLSCGVCYGAAGFVDAFEDHQQWMMPAYKYCGAFGIAILLVLLGVSLIWKTKINRIMNNLSDFLIRQPTMAVILTGFIWAIILGLWLDVMWEVIYLGALLPALAFMVLFPIILTNREIREKFLLNPMALKWWIMFVVAAIGASVLFIVLTNNDLLPGTDITFRSRPDRMHHDFFIARHPYDSMSSIWGSTTFYMAEIGIALIMLLFGNIYRYMDRRLSISRRLRFL